MTASGTTTANNLVANPMHTALSALYAKLQQDAPTMSNAMKAASQQMAAGQTWVGPAATSWDGQLAGYSGDCANQVNAMLADVAQALQSEPAQVTSAVAQQKARELTWMQRANIG